MDLAQILSYIDELDHQRTHVLLSAVRSFNHLHYEDYIDKFRQIIDNFIDETHGEQATIIYSALTDIIYELLLEMGITLSATVNDNLTYLVRMLHGITEITDTELVDDALTICNSHYHAREVFSELLQLVTHRSPEYYLAHLLNVDEMLIDKIKEELLVRSNSEIGDHFETTQAHEQAIKLCKKLMSEYKSANIGLPLSIEKYLNSPESIGWDFNTYFKEYKDTSVNKLQSTDTKVEIQVIYEVVGMICLSRESVTGFIGRSSELSDSLYIDLAKKKRFVQNLDLLLQRVSHG